MIMCSCQLCIEQIILHTQQTCKLLQQSQIVHVHGPFSHACIAGH